MKHSEDKIQSDFHQWLFGYYPYTRQLAYHIPNGGLRNIREANKLKAMGVVAGMPDYHIAIANHGYNSLYIEFKEPGAKMNTEHGKNQIMVHDRLKAAGNKVIICYSLEEAQSEVLSYLPGQYLLRSYEQYTYSTVQ